MKVISLMDTLCKQQHKSMHKAAKIASGEDVENSPKRSEDAWMTIGWRQITRWYCHWLDFGALPCQTNPKFMEKYNTMWNEDRDAALKRIVDKCPVLYLDEIVKLLEEEFGAVFGASSVSCRLRNTLGYTRKVVYEKACQQVSRDKMNFIDAMRLHLDNAEMAIFIDESNKDRVAARRKYGWSRKGTPVNCRSMFNVGPRYTFIGAADCFGFVIPACDIVMHQ